MKPSKSILFALTVFLIVINLIAVAKYDEATINIMRVVNMILFFLFFLWQKRFSKIQLAVFILLLICDILLLDYQNPIFNLLIFLTRMMAYFLLFVMLIPKLRRIQINLFQVAIFIGLMGLGVFLLSALYDMIPSKEKFTTFQMLFYVYGIAGLFAIISAVYFNNRFENKTSFYFIMAIMGLLLSDLTYFIATYLEFPEFYYPDRVLNIIGIAALVYYVKLDRKREKAGGFQEL